MRRESANLRSMNSPSVTLPHDAAFGLSGVQPQAYMLHDLRLSVGHRLQIRRPGHGDLTTVRMIGYVRGETLIIKLATAQLTGSDAIGEGEKLEVRGFSGQVAFTFVTTVEQIRFSPYAYCHLRYPELVHGLRLRHAERVMVNLPVRVEGGSAAGDALSATIANISINGAMLTAPESLGDVGDELKLTFRFWVLPSEYEVNMRVDAVVQSVTGPEPDGEFRHGVQFKHVRSTESILLQNLIYQRLQEDPEATV